MATATTFASYNVVLCLLRLPKSRRTLRKCTNGDVEEAGGKGESFFTFELDLASAYGLVSLDVFTCMYSVRGLHVQVSFFFLREPVPCTLLRERVRVVSA